MIKEVKKGQMTRWHQIKNINKEIEIWGEKTGNYGVKIKITEIKKVSRLIQSI